ncbi:MAG: hypothetical protein PHW04_01725 [Candidatus Wallbacteria bacterium]|nr:hypothetical protein [Candidatus Wallbacteria bacterium]
MYSNFEEIEYFQQVDLNMEFTASFDTSSRSILKVNLDFKRVGDTYPASEYASYKKFIEDIVNFQDEWILLEKK